MSNKLISLLDDLESRAKAMPALLQRALDDNTHLREQLDSVTHAAGKLALRLEGQTGVIKAKFSALETLLTGENKRQSGRLADASAGLRALEQLGKRQITEQEDDRKLTAGLVTKLVRRSGSLAKTTLNQDIDQVKMVINNGLSAIEKAQGRLAETCKKLMGEMGNLDQATQAASRQTSQAGEHFLSSIQKAASQADLGRGNFHTATETQAKSFDDGLSGIHRETVARPTLARTAQYKTSVQDLKKSAKRSLLSVTGANENHVAQAEQANTTINNSYREQESLANAQTAAVVESLKTSDSQLSQAWQKIPLKSDSQTDDRNLLQKAWDFPGYAAGKVLEFGAWAIKGVTETVAKYHKEILIGLAVCAGVVAGVLLAPVVVPALMAGASVAISAIGSGITAGLSTAGSALAGVGSAFAGFGTWAGGVALAGKSAAVGFFSAGIPAMGAIPEVAAGAGYTFFAGGHYVPWLVGGGLTGAASYLQHGKDTGDWTVKAEGVRVGFNVGSDGKSVGASANAALHTNLGDVGASTPTVNIPLPQEEKKAPEPAQPGSDSASNSESAEDVVADLSDGLEPEMKVVLGSKEQGLMQKMHKQLAKLPSDSVAAKSTLEALRKMGKDFGMSPEEVDEWMKQDAKSAVAGAQRDAAQDRLKSVRAAGEVSARRNLAQEHFNSLTPAQRKEFKGMTKGGYLTNGVDLFDPDNNFKKVDLTHASSTKTPIDELRHIEPLEPTSPKAPPAAKTPAPPKGPTTPKTPPAPPRTPPVTPPLTRTGQIIQYGEEMVEAAVKKMGSAGSVLQAGQKSVSGLSTELRAMGWEASQFATNKLQALKMSGPVQAAKFIYDHGTTGVVIRRIGNLFGIFAFGGVGTLVTEETLKEMGQPVPGEVI